MHNHFIKVHYYWISIVNKLDLPLHKLIGQETLSHLYYEEHIAFAIAFMP